MTEPTLPVLNRSLGHVPAELLALPEKAVQFGTGAFLRGFVDWFLDAANRAGTFGGRVVAIGSTGSGRDATLTEQDGLYTLVVQGAERGEAVRQTHVISSVSRALSAATEWDAVLAVARSPQLEYVFSNTTEVGIALDPDDAFDAAPPRSFPGKLTRFLYERARAVDFDAARGVVVLPCELIEDNGARLREIVLQLADRWALGPDCTRWIAQAVPFCNTLVDRIVPGAPPAGERAALEARLGYTDALLTTCEPYRLFAIECDAATRARLAFLADADPGVVLTDDVRPYRERKVRLLNGTHTVCVSAAILAGCETVREAVRHEQIGPFLRRVLFDETIPTLDVPEAEAFAQATLQRFDNPFIRHALWDITLQGTMKMRVRVVPTIARHVARTGSAPAALTFGFAAFLEFLRGEAHAARVAAGLPIPADDQADAVRAHWAAAGSDPEAMARAVCADASLWGTDLSALPGVTAAVAEHLTRIRAHGVAGALDALLAEAAR